MATRLIHPQSRNCYVYAISVDGIIRYIGKGSGYRIGRHFKRAEEINRLRDEGRRPRALKFHNRLAKAMRNGSLVTTDKIATGLSSGEALAREIAEIAAAPDGQLWNETRGGEGLDPETARRLWATPAHRKKMATIHSDPAFIDGQRLNTIRQFSDAEERRKASERSKALWRDPAFVEKTVAAVRAGVATEASRQKVREAAIRRLSNPAEFERVRLLLKAVVSTEAFRARQRQRMKELWKDPVFRARCTAQWSDPEKRRKRAANLTPEFLARRGRAIAAGLARRKARTGSVR